MKRRVWRGYLRLFFMVRLINLSRRDNFAVLPQFRKRLAIPPNASQIAMVEVARYRRGAD